MILKFKVYLVGNSKSKQLIDNIQNYLENKYYDVINYHYYDNFVLDSMSVYQKVSKDNKKSVSFMFCEYGESLLSLFKNSNGAKKIIVKKQEKYKESYYLNANVLIFSLKEFNYEEIIRVINYYLNLYVEEKLFY